jgi:tetratricopeptide (TPR) repeat protein
VLAFERRLLLEILNGQVQGAAPGGTDPTVDRAFFQAASLLHADAAFSAWENFRGEAGWFHLTFARRLVDASDDPSANEDSFRRRWYTATALILTGVVTPSDALKYFEDLTAALPDDAPLLTAAGWFSEWLSDRPVNPGSDFDRATQGRREDLARAGKFLRAALGVDPHAADAALRLARIEAAMGQLAPAAMRLTALLTRDDLARPAAYTGRLLLGQVREREGKSADAERLYREAITRDPVAQAARIALARLLYAAGDSSGAAAALAPALAPGPQRNDPWSEYKLGPPAIARMTFDKLRLEVQR